MYWLPLSSSPPIVRKSTPITHSLNNTRRPSVKAQVIYRAIYSGTKCKKVSGSLNCTNTCPPLKEVASKYSTLPSDSCCYCETKSTPPFDLELDIRGSVLEIFAIFLSQTTSNWEELSVMAQSPIDYIRLRVRGWWWSARYGSLLPRPLEPLAIRSFNHYQVIIISCCCDFITSLLPIQAFASFPIYSANPVAFFASGHRVGLAKP